MLMTPPDGEMPSLTNASQATAILAVATDSGMSETQRWELALLIGTDPEDHGIASPRIGEEAVEAIINSHEFGIPSMTIERWLQKIEEEPAC